MSDRPKFSGASQGPRIRVSRKTSSVFKTENRIEGSERLARRVNSVHVNDWIDPPRGYSDRWLPGEGIIPPAEVFGALECGGYEGTYDREIFAHEGLEHDGDKALWRKPADEMVRLGRAGFDKAWEESQR